MTHSNHVDAIVQYAVAAARVVHDDDWLLQDLGPIHLVKYVYLADLLHAQRQHGQIYSGAPWVFYHFGPWSVEVHNRIAPALTQIGAERRKIDSKYGDDFHRWRLSDLQDAEECCRALERQLPMSITAGLRALVREHGNATYELLNHVYRTTPMLRAAPEELLDFSPIAAVSGGVAERQAAYTAEHRLAEHRNEHLAASRERFRERLQEKLRNKEHFRAVQRQPRYDEVFEAGLRALDDLAGPSPENRHGMLEFGANIWHSPIRAGVDDD